MRIITTESMEEYRSYLISEERAKATIEKYMKDLFQFYHWMSSKCICKTDVLTYKAKLTAQYAPTSVNAVLSALNSFFNYMGWSDLKVKNLKIQKQFFISPSKELTKAEYERLLFVAKEKKNERLYFLMQTICSTGIRVSEVRFITVDTIDTGVVEIRCKGKSRQVYLSKKLCDCLKQYIKKNKIKSGSVFVTKNGNPLDRSNIWSQMKRICVEAHVSEKKVFPHNLRHLFARTYYSVQKDIVRLADILGHSSVNTTRIYTAESGEIHRNHMQKLGLIFC